MELLTPEQLVTESKCLACVPDGIQLPALIYLFCRIASVNPDPNSLMESAKCMKCIPNGMQMPVLIDLANQILGSLGSGTGLCLLAGSGAPVGPPACAVALYFDTSKSPNLGLYVWVQALSVWVEVISSGP